MRRLLEDILTEEEMEQEMDAKAEERERALLFCNDIFIDAGFSPSSDANNITYTKEDKGYKALFNIDATTFNYSCYITTEGDNSSTYSAKGVISGIEDAVYKFLSSMSDIVEV